MRAQAMARQRRAARQRARGAQEAVLQLWAHEARRVFGDRLRGPADGAWLHGALDEGLRGAFATSQAELFAAQAACPPFAAFLSAGAGAAYQPAGDMRALQARARTPPGAHAPHGHGCRAPPRPADLP